MIPNVENLRKAAMKATSAQQVAELLTHLMFWMGGIKAAADNLGVPRVTVEDLLDQARAARAFLEQRIEDLER